MFYAVISPKKANQRSEHSTVSTWRNYVQSQCKYANSRQATQISATQTRENHVIHVIRVFMYSCDLKFFNSSKKLAAIFPVSLLCENFIYLFFLNLRIM